MRNYIQIGALFAFTVPMLGCGGKSKPVAAPAVESAPSEAETGDRQEKPDAPVVDTRVVDEDQKPVAFGAIYFEFDSADLTERSKGTLEEVAAYLKKRGKASITIGGHTDERGTSEYNLALGDRRARAAEDFLVRLGVPERQIKTITYGEEKPAVQGQDESSWSRNRRDELQID